MREGPLGKIHPKSPFAHRVRSYDSKGSRDQSARQASIVPTDHPPRTCRSAPCARLGSWARSILKAVRAQGALLQQGTPDRANRSTTPAGAPHGCERTDGTRGVIVAQPFFGGLRRQCNCITLWT